MTAVPILRSTNCNQSLKFPLACLSRSGLDTAEDSTAAVAAKIAELVGL
jgi:hypothetical protein